MTKHYQITTHQSASHPQQVGYTMETIIRDKLMNFIDENRQIDDDITQYGFRHKRSCLKNLCDFYNDVFNNHDETKAVDIIYLDFQKTFDKAHNRPLKKLESHSIAGKILKRLPDWLTEKKQFVLINSKSTGQML